MSAHRYWTIKDIAHWSGVGYGTVMNWVEKQRFTTYKQPEDLTLYVHPSEAERISEMCRISIQGLPGWGRLQDVTRRYSVSRATVSRWAKEGKILTIHTYGHTLYSVDSVLGYTDWRTRQAALAQAKRWEGPRRRYPRVVLKEKIS